MSRWRPITVASTGPGSTVVVRNDEETEQYTLVGPAEVDPRHGRVSVHSPVGEALLGRRAGDVVEVDAPGGRRRLEIKIVE